MRNVRRLAVASSIGWLLALSMTVLPAMAGELDDVVLSADLDGQPIKLVEVGDHYCHDFDYPLIHCFSKPDDLESSTSYAAGAASGVQYATIYDYTGFQGSYMHMSENYTILAFLGWNDRISSFKVRNSQSGNFYVDWYYGGTVYGFCCNQWLAGLGSFDNTFSSVYRF